MSLAKVSFKSALRAAFVTGLSASAVMLAAPAMAGVVVKSSGPSASAFPVGKKMKDTDKITLKAGDTVTILTSGGTRVLKGAGTYRVGARGKKTRQNFAKLTRSQLARNARPGVARTGSGEVRSPNLWYVDVTQSGKVCVSSLDNVTLWRPQVDEDQTFIIGKIATTVTFAVLAETPTNAEAMADTLIAQGCTVQLDLLARSLEDAPA